MPVTCRGRRRIFQDFVEPPAVQGCRLGIRLKDVRTRLQGGSGAVV